MSIKCWQTSFLLSSMYNQSLYELNFDGLLLSFLVLKGPNSNVIINYVPSSTLLGSVSIEYSNINGKIFQ